MKAVIACGGTGGHLFPGLAVGEVLVKRGWEVMLIISEKEIDSLAVQGRTEFRFEKVQSIGMPSLFSPAIFAFSVRFARSVGQCRKLLRNFRPDLVLGMGGFTSTPPILAARMAKIPCFVHESNAIPGKANRVTARFVDCVLLGFEECAKHFAGKETSVTGTPVRAGLQKKVAKEEVYPKLGLTAANQTILVMGGSQGARGINHAITQSLPHFAGKPIQFAHLTGPGADKEVLARYEAAKVPAYVAPFHHAMEDLYAIAEFAVARSGASSLSELSFFGIPSVLIPYPYAAEDHQTFNAQIFARSGAAVLLKEADATGEALSRILLEFLEDSEKRNAMAEKAKLLTPADAAVVVADTMLTYLK